MGENICKQCNRKWINLQILHTAHAGKKKKTNQTTTTKKHTNNPIQNQAEDLNKYLTTTTTNHTDGQQAHKKILSISNYWRNANQNYSELSPHASQTVHHKNVYK